MIANKNPGNIISACLLKLEEKFVDLCFRHVLTQQFAVLHYRNILQIYLMFFHIIILGVSQRLRWLSKTWLQL